MVLLFYFNVSEIESCFIDVCISCSVFSYSKKVSLVLLRLRGSPVDSVEMKVVEKIKRG